MTSYSKHIHPQKKNFFPLCPAHKCIKLESPPPSSPTPNPPPYLRLEDDPRTRLNYYFDPVADKIKEVQDRGGRTLLHCVAGVSRSASLTIAYLVKHKGMHTVVQNDQE